jgi:hypothetical protein
VPMSTELLAGDISASLTFFLSNELVDAFRNVLSTPEVIIFALLVAVLARVAAEWLAHAQPQPQRPGETGALLPLARDELRRLAETVQFLASTSVVQIAALLVRSQVKGPAARVVTIVSVLLLLRIVLSSVRLQRRPLIARND